MNKIKSAFSLIELSIVIVIIGILIIGITKGSRIIKAAKLTSARTLTKGSPVTSIPNLVYWFEPTSATSFKNQNGSSDIQDGDTISSWFDVNPLNKNTTSVDQATQANQPKYIVNGINGLPTVRFDVTNDTQRLYTTGIMNGYNIETTFFMVVKYTSSHGVNSQAIDFGGLVNGLESGHSMYIDTSKSVGSGYYNGSSTEGSSLSSANLVSANQVLLMTRYFNGSRAISKFTVNQTTVSPSTGVVAKGRFGPSSFTGIVIGNHENAPRTFGGDISEIIIYDRQLQDSEITAVQNYLKQKYNIK